MPYQSQNLNLPDPPEGLAYRNMGTMENHVWSVIAKRMKHGHRSWSKRGGNHLAKILAKKCSGKLYEVTECLRRPVFEETKKSTEETLKWIEETIQKNYSRTYPILTPRFIPTCTDEVMKELKKLQKRYELPLQSHLSENFGEIAWVKELCPWSEFYGDVYDTFGLFGKDTRTIMAHCVHSDEREISRMKENGVFIAHCPESNMNVSSGIAPIRKFLEEGLHVGLGSDVAGGSTENMFRAMAHAVQASKLRWRICDDSLEALTSEEVFFMATKGGGEFFGKVGSFEPGYEFDAVVLDDSRLAHPQELDIRSRLERMIYLADEREVVGKYVKGKEIDLS